MRISSANGAMTGARSRALHAWMIAVRATVAVVATLVVAAAPARTHAAPPQYTTFDAPGAVGTFFNAVNDRGTIAGDYYDDAGVAHGFVLSH